MKKALITGITGMVGSHLVDFLLAETDWDVYGVCRWRSPLDNVSHLLERVNKKERVFFDYADLNDQVSLMTVINKVKPDCIPLGCTKLSTDQFYRSAGYPEHEYSWDM